MFRGATVIIKLTPNHDSMTRIGGRVLANVDMADVDTVVSEIETYAPPAEVRCISDMSDAEIEAEIARAVWAPIVYPIGEN
jgi:hypothetical protein